MQRPYPLDPMIQAAQRAAGGAAIAAAFLAVGKLMLFLFSGSLIIALSAWDSGMDVFISFINRMIVKFSRQSADTNHPYGHGKAESITALGQGALITGGALAILASSSQKLYETGIGKGELIVESWPIVFFFIFASVVSYLITLWLRHFGKLCNSPALLADSAHYRVDVASNLASAASLSAIIFTKNIWLDPLIAGIFSLYIIWSGFRLLRTSVNELMDHEVEDEIRKKILDVISKADDKILDIHNFRSRKSGYCYFFDFHVTLPHGLAFQEVHRIVQAIEESIHQTVHADVVVRADPDSLTAAEPKVVAFHRYS